MSEFFGETRDGMTTRECQQRRMAAEKLAPKSHQPQPTPEQRKREFIESVRVRDPFSPAHIQD